MERGLLTKELVGKAIPKKKKVTWSASSTWKEGTGAPKDRSGPASLFLFLVFVPVRALSTLPPPTPSTATGNP